MSVSYSSHAPRLGLIVLENSSIPVLSWVISKYTPGERTSWETMTLSAPLITKVPLSVMMGNSPINTSDSFIAPVSLLSRRTVTRMGAA